MLDTNSTTDLTVSKDFKLVRFVSQLLVDQLTGKYAIDGFQRQWALFRQSIAPRLKHKYVQDVSKSISPVKWWIIWAQSVVHINRQRENQNWGNHRPTSDFDDRIESTFNRSSVSN